MMPIEKFSKQHWDSIVLLSRGCYGLCHDMDNDNIFEDSTLDLPLDSGAVIEDTC